MRNTVIAIIGLVIFFAFIKFFLVVGGIVALCASGYFLYQAVRDKDNRQTLLKKRLLPAVVAMVLCFGFTGALSGGQQTSHHEAAGSSAKTTHKHADSSSTDDSNDDDEDKDDFDSESSENSSGIPDQLKILLASAPVAPTSQPLRRMVTQTCIIMAI